tara:strand:- start:117 stop:506 length:390 start_codon:yes stop_codon:yes gene_type:complete
MYVTCLVDLNSFRSSPKLSKGQIKQLLDELEPIIFNSDWVTIGIMASHDFEAIQALQSVSKKYPEINFSDLDTLHAEGSVFLKGNQKTGNVFIRSENGLGEGILLTCQYDDKDLDSSTYGPFPLDFFTY